MSAAVAHRVHPWEKAGLGKAPFTWTGVSEDRGPHRSVTPEGITIEIGAPGQPMGCCAYCSNGIAECHHIRSADGREFVVGCDCVKRVEHPGSPVYTKAERAAKDLRNAKARHAAAERARGVRVELAALLADEAVRAKLSALPHPHEWRAAQGETRLSEAEWYLKNAGAKGKSYMLQAVKIQVSK